MFTPSGSQTSAKSAFKNPMLYTAALIAVVAIYVGWIVISRYTGNRAYEKRIRDQQAERQHKSDEAAIEQLGGNDLAIQMLYAPSEIHRGESAQICFGVANAKAVTLERQSSPVWPSHNLCVDVKPTETTTYTLTATGADHRSVSQEITVAVR